MDREIEVPSAVVSAPTRQHSAREVAGIVAGMGSLAAKYSDLFEKQGVDGPLFFMLDEKSLEELGVDSSLARKKIMSWIAEHK